MRRTIAALAALTLALGIWLPGGGNPPRAAALDVYTDPGTHLVNGRKWRTTCSAYSPTITRCRTEIWASVILRDARGRFSQSDGWAFNNLTYKPVARSAWGTNPLASDGSWIQGGRQWRTECGTPATGADACRSYIRGTVYSRTGSSYVASDQWVFNNIVRFTPGSAGAYPSAPPMTVAPAFLKGRRHFTLGTLITQTNAGTKARGIGRLSNIELDPGGKVGTFKESYWAYTFDMADAEKDYGQFRASIPNPPTGCTSSAAEASDRSLLKLPQWRTGVCDVRTARTFLAAPTVRYGTYEALTGSGGNRLRLYWRNSFVTETYVDASRTTASYSELRLAGQNHPAAVNAIGFMFGSTTPPGAGRSMASQIQRPQWKAPRSLDGAVIAQSQFAYNAGGADRTLWTQSLGSASLLSSRQSFRFQDYIAAGGASGCIVTPPDVRGRTTNGWHSYFCPLASEGRLVWHHMASSLVTEAHGLCPAYVAGTSWEQHRARCEAASPKAVNHTLPVRPGGHVYEALQVVDDNSTLMGVVGLETSLYSPKASSQSQLGLFAALAADA